MRSIFSFASLIGLLKVFTRTIKRYLLCNILVWVNNQISIFVDISVEEGISQDTVWSPARHGHQLTWHPREVDICIENILHSAWKTKSRLRKFPEGQEKVTFCLLLLWLPHCEVLEAKNTKIHFVTCNTCISHLRHVNQIVRYSKFIQRISEDTMNPVGTKLNFCSTLYNKEH